MGRKKKVIPLSLPAINYAKLPNLWHQEQVMRGGKIHKSDRNVLPRKMKYKNITY